MERLQQYPGIVGIAVEETYVEVLRSQNEDVAHDLHLVGLESSSNCFGSDRPDLLDLPVH